MPKKDECYLADYKNHSDYQLMQLQVSANLNVFSNLEKEKLAHHNFRQLWINRLHEHAKDGYFVRKKGQCPLCKYKLPRKSFSATKHICNRCYCSLNNSSSRLHEIKWLVDEIGCSMYKIEPYLGDYQPPEEMKAPVFMGYEWVDTYQIRKKHQGKGRPHVTNHSKFCQAKVRKASSQNKQCTNHPAIGEKYCNIHLERNTRIDNYAEFCLNRNKYIEEQWKELEHLIRISKADDITISEAIGMTVEALKEKHSGVVKPHPTGAIISKEKVRNWYNKNKLPEGWPTLRGYGCRNSVLSYL